MSRTKAGTTRFNNKTPKNIPRIHFPDHARIQLYQEVDAFRLKMLLVLRPIENYHSNMTIGKLKKTIKFLKQRNTDTAQSFN